MIDTIAVHETKKLITALFGTRFGFIFFNSPSNEHYVPVSAVETGSVICDAPYQIRRDPRGFATSEIYFPITIPPEASFFVHFNDHAFQVVCALDCNIDHLIAAIECALKAKTPNQTAPADASMPLSCCDVFDIKPDEL